MVKFNDFLYYYPRVEKLQRGMLGATIFIVKGDKTMFMVDPGVLGGNVEKHYEKLMLEDRIEINKIERIYITHAHPDHMIGASYWQKKINPNGIPVYLHPHGVPFMSDPSLLLTGLINEAGWIQKEISKLPVGLGNMAFDLLWTKQEPIGNVHPTSDNEIIDIGNVLFRVEFTEGHSLNHSCYRIIDKSTNQSILISGDLISFKVLEKGQDIHALASVNTVTSDFSKELASLKRILNDPPDILFTGHYGIYQPKDEIVKRFKEAIELAETYKPRILEFLKTGAKSFKEITKHLIYFKHYLSGYATRTSTTYVVLRELLNEGTVKEIDTKKHIFALL